MDERVRTIAFSLANPKSVILSLQSLDTSRFPGFRSLLHVKDVSVLCSTTTRTTTTTPVYDAVVVQVLHSAQQLVHEVSEMSLRQHLYPLAHY